MIIEKFVVTVFLIGHAVYTLFLNIYLPIFYWDEYKAFVEVDELVVNLIFAFTAVRTACAFLNIYGAIKSKIWALTTTSVTSTMLVLTVGSLFLSEMIRTIKCNQGMCFFDQHNCFVYKFMAALPLGLLKISLFRS